MADPSVVSIPCHGHPRVGLMGPSRLTLAAVEGRRWWKPEVRRSGERRTAARFPVERVGIVNRQGPTKGRAGRSERGAEAEEEVDELHDRPRHQRRRLHRFARHRGHSPASPLGLLAIDEVECDGRAMRRIRSCSSGIPRRRSKAIGLPWNQRSACCGIADRLAVESVIGLAWNR